MHFVVIRRHRTRPRCRHLHENVAPGASGCALVITHLSWRTITFRFNERSAPVTRGSRGLGFGVARVLAAEGCDIHIASRSADDLEVARARLVQDHDARVPCHAPDLSRTDNAVRLARMRRRRHPDEQCRRHTARQVDEVANMAAFLCSAASAYTTITTNEEAGARR